MTQTGLSEALKCARTARGREISLYIGRSAPFCLCLRTFVLVEEIGCLFLGWCSLVLSFQLLCNHVNVSVCGFRRFIIADHIFGACRPWDDGSNFLMWVCGGFWPRAKHVEPAAETFLLAPGQRKSERAPLALLKPSFSCSLSGEVRAKGKNNCKVRFTVA